MHTTEIAIIGAGLAGLTCAHRLQSYGHDVIVCEALNRPGGRVLTHHTGNSHEELGAKFLSDSVENVNLMPLIHEFNLEIVTSVVNFTRLIAYQGQVYLYHLFFDLLPPPTDKTYKELQTRAASCRTLAEVLDPFFADSHLIRNVFEVRLRNYEGASTSQLSAKYLDLFWRFYLEGHESLQNEKHGKHETYTIQTIKGGNTRLIDSLCHSLQGRVWYRMPLIRVQEDPSKKILLTFQGGEQILTERLVLTVPLPILKTIAFDDSLFDPKRKQIIDSLPYGSIAKFIVPVVCLQKPDAEFTYTDDAVIWFNADYTLMTIYFGGEAAMFPTDMKSIQKVYQRELEEDLKHLFPKILFPPVENIIGMSWTQEPFFQGGYSNFGVEHYDLLHETMLIHCIPIKKVFAPLNNRIYFAGEATAIRYPATMEGAVDSAERISKLVHKCRPC